MGRKGNLAVLKAITKEQNLLKPLNIIKISKSSELSISFGNFINREIAVNFDFQMIII